REVIWPPTWLRSLTISLPEERFMAAENRSGLVRMLRLAAVVVGAGILVLSAWVLEPFVHAQSASAKSESKIEIPPYDHESWSMLPVQDGGRTKPFESASREAMRNITGSSRFEGHDPVAVILMWMMLQGTNEGTRQGDWETYHFILCQDQDLRRAIYRDIEGPDEELSAEQVAGKYVSPRELRKSQAFKKLLEEADEIEDADKEKASQLMSPGQRKA